MLILASSILLNEFENIIYNTGSGKTTLVQKACDVLQKKGVSVQGFYTEEVRQHGKRIGFDVVTLDGNRGALARVE